MKFVSYNIQYGFGADGRYDLERAAEVIASADVIALQEVERGWQRTGSDDQPELLSRLLPNHYWVYGPAFDMDASRVGAGGKVINDRRQFGTMLLSRFPILWSRLHLLPMRKVVRPLNTQNAALEGLIRTPAGAVRVFSIHLSHIGVEERLEQIAFLQALHRRVALEGGPWSGIDDEPERDWAHGEGEPEAPLAAIWMGDFNSQPGSEEYLAITGRNPSHPTAAYLDGFVDAAVMAGAAASPSHTHVRTHRGEVQKRRLDYCFVGSMLAERVRSVSVDTDCIASDHFPVAIDINLETPGDGCRSMTLPVFLAVLAAAAMHAAWNATIKVRLDRFASISLMTVGMGVVALPALPLVALPGALGWLLIAASVALHIGYRLFLVKAYAAGDLAQTYPLARGAAPLLTTLGGIVLIREIPGGLAISGILLLSAGTLLMSMRGGNGLTVERRAIGFAFVTSLFVAAYTLTDGMGARSTDGAASYAAWLFATDAVVTGALVVFMRGGGVVSAMLLEWRTGLITGALAAGAYWIAVWAMTQAPIASVAALRETSILFAMAISVFSLGEAVTRWRIAAALLIVCGIIALKLG